MRKSGVLLHISSLWGGFSFGSFGKSAVEFIDFLEECGFSFWQVLPFCQPDEYFSPYKSSSAFSLSPFFIDLSSLLEKGLITKDELETAREKSPHLCEVERTSERLSLLKKASEKFNFKECEEYFFTHPESEAFCRFEALQKGEAEYKFRRFTEYTAFEEWQKIKKYANEKKIEIIGDLPIYISFNSADVWEKPELFELDKNGSPTAVAGVPPDDFSKSGQLWGNPLYRWNRMKKDGFAWWKRRIELAFELFDGIRLDHFRAFDAYYSIPAGEKNAVNGEWKSGPSRPFIREIKKLTKDKFVVCENLGHITESVESLLKYSGFYDTRVLQFGFNESDSPHLPHNYSPLSVAYTSTHDNNTFIGFLANLPEEKRHKILRYFDYRGHNWYECYPTVIRGMLASSAGVVIFPIQDLLGYGEDTRMNVPGKSEGNWRFRITKEQLDRIDKASLLDMNRLYGRKIT